MSPWRAAILWYISYSLYFRRCPELTPNVLSNIDYSNIDYKRTKVCFKKWNSLFWGLKRIKSCFFLKKLPCCRCLQWRTRTFLSLSLTFFPWPPPLRKRLEWWFTFHQRRTIYRLVSLIRKALQDAFDTKGWVKEHCQVLWPTDDIFWRQREREIERERASCDI